MNTGILTSFIVGGLLLISMIHLNNQALQNSTNVTLDLHNKTQIETIRKIIKQDFSRIGFGKNSKIKSFNPPHFINFSADVSGNGTSEVIWHFKESVQVKKTSNPNDRILQRNGPVDKTGGSKPTKFRVVDFSITGYSDIEGKNETTDKEQIKSLRINIVYESPENTSTSDDYSKTVWQKLIVPNNLQL